MKRLKKKLRLLKVIVRDQCDPVRNMSIGRFQWKSQAYEKHVLYLQLQNFYHEPIIFTLEYGKEVTFSHKDSLVITIVLSNHNMRKVLMKNKRDVNILFK